MDSAVEREAKARLLEIQQQRQAAKNKVKVEPEHLGEGHENGVRDEQRQAVETEAEKILARHKERQKLLNKV